MDLAQLPTELEKIKRDFTPDLVRIAHKANDYVTRRIQENFAGHQAPDGTHWEGVDEITLQHTGDMFASLMGNGPGAINKIVVNGDRVSLERGSDLPQTSYQFYGVPKTGKKRASSGGGRGRGRKRKKRKQLPPSSYRIQPHPMIGFVDRDAQAIAEIAADDILAWAVK